MPEEDEERVTVPGDAAEPFIPASEDDDPEANEQMQMGKGEENYLYDPWFGTPEYAEDWRPGEGG